MTIDRSTKPSRSLWQSRGFARRLIRMDTKPPDLGPNQSPGRPRGRATEPTILFSIRMSRQYRDWVEDVAADQRCSVAALIERSLSDRAERLSLQGAPA